MQWSEPNVTPASQVRIRAKLLSTCGKINKQIKMWLPQNIVRSCISPISLTRIAAVWLEPPAVNMQPNHFWPPTFRCKIVSFRPPSLSLSLSPVRVRDHGPVRDTGWHNSTNQSGPGKTENKISQRWTTRKLRVQHATSCHCGRTLKKNLSKCHPNVLMDGHVSSEVYKQNSTPNSSRDSRKQI